MENNINLIERLRQEKHFAQCDLDAAKEEMACLKAELKTCQDLRIIDDKVAQHLKARHKAEVDEDLIERDALKE